MIARAAQGSASAPHVVLVGTGAAHLYLLRHWAATVQPSVRISVVAQDAQMWHEGRMVGFVADHHRLDQCHASIEPLLRRSRVQWLQTRVKVLDVENRTMLLDNGQSLSFDLLSIDEVPQQHRSLADASLPGSREHGLFLRPWNVFADLWPQVVALAHERPLRIAVIGGLSPQAAAWPLAVKHRLPTSSVTWIPGQLGVAPHAAAPLRRTLQRALHAQGVTVLCDTAVSLDGQGVRLACGAQLACDVPIITALLHPPRWLQQCGLALDTSGAVQTDGLLQSVSHANVLSTNSTAEGRELDGYRLGQLLQKHLTAALNGRSWKAPAPPQYPWEWVYAGQRHAIGAWRFLCVQGGWAWHFQNWRQNRYFASLE